MATGKLWKTDWQRFCLLQHRIEQGAIPFHKTVFGIYYADQDLPIVADVILQTKRDEGWNTCALPEEIFEGLIGSVPVSCRFTVNALIEVMDAVYLPLCELYEFEGNK